jgi:DNA-binding XRE family transcriptional regulator
MSQFFDETLQGLLEAVVIEKSNIPLTTKENMPAQSFYIAEKDRILVDQMVLLRKEKNISQKELAELTGNKQQAISRIERKENTPSLRIFCNILNALGYELQIVEKKE